MSALRFSLALAAVGLCCLAAVVADPSLEGLTAEEEECPADGSDREACTLSLRQLRVRGVVEATAAAAVAAPPAPGPAAEKPAQAPVAAVEDPSLGVPGGWGEPANFARDLRSEGEENATLKAQWSDFDDDGYGHGGGYGGWQSGSCAAYGCLNYYAPWHTCQCNTHCARFNSCCHDYTSFCHQHTPAPTPAPHYHPPAPSHTRNVKTLYHQTDQHAANLIIKSGFRPGSHGWCGGAIYFATSAKATYTKAIGPQSHKGAMLQVQVDVGRVLYQDKTCGGKQHNQAELNSLGYDSISFNPGDGAEFVIWDKSKVLSIKQIPL